MKVYLDIDGTILTPDGLAEGAKEFILSAVSHHDVYWLTTHKADALSHLRSHVDQETYKALAKIQPTEWSIFKTEALDPSDPDWIWLDDCLLHADREWLKNHDCEAQWIRINLDEDPDAWTALQEDASA